MYMYCTCIEVYVDDDHENRTPQRNVPTSKEFLNSLHFWLKYLFLPYRVCECFFSSLDLILLDFLRAI